MIKISWKYAIGEILIVIIGVSIAFGLSSWGDSRKEANLRHQYLQNLQNDIEDEIEHLTENKEKLKTHIASSAQLLPYLGNPTPRRDTMIRKAFSLVEVINFIPNTTTYRTLTNSGHLSLIGSLDLRQKIEAHYNNHALVQQAYDRQIKIHERYMGDFFIYNLDYDKIYKGDTGFMDMPVYKNIIQSLNGAFKMAVKASDKGIASNETLLKSVRTELSKQH